MTERNHRRGTVARKHGRAQRCHYSGLPKGQSREWQRIAHGKRRGLVLRLLHSGKVDDIPGNTPRHIRWDYW